MPDSMELACSICGHQLNTERGLKQHITKIHGRDAAVADFGADRDEDGPFDEEIKPVPVFEDEAPPIEAPKSTWREKMWGTGPKAPKAVTLGERRPRKRRVSTEGIWSTAWTGCGVALQRTGADIPVGRCMQFQAPIVGDILDEAIAGTFIDTLLQPIAGSGKRFKKVSAVVSLPILVGLIERNPSAAPMLEPLLREVLRENLVALAASAKKVRKEEEQYRKALEDLGMEVGDDPIDSLMADIFSVPAEPVMNGARVGADV